MVTPISEIIFSGFVSKIVNNSVDTSWKKIKKVIKNKKTEHQNMESQIYNVIVNALNQVTYNEYEKNQDKIYQAAENLLLGYEKVKSDDIEIVRLGLNILGKKVDNEVYLEFKGMIYNEISKKENVELYHAILLWLLDQKNKYDEIEIEQLNQKLDAVLRILRTKKTEPNLHNSNTYREIKSRTQEYADKWNQNMFLNDFDKRDENAGVNVKLSEVYLEKHLPHYIWGSNRNVSEDLMKLLKEYIYGNNENRMLLILGQPGIGKSTLITWIVANFTDKVDDILVYKFAPDLKNIGWKSNNIFDKILETLKLTYNDLNGKILILDGFDEVNVENGRNKILDKIYWSLNGNLTEKILLIITCRENCIHDLEKIKGQYITLTPWNEKQIESFCFVFREKTYSKISKHTIRNVIRNREILGIPLILYIVLALNISIGENGSIVDIYDRIFSLKENSIYDRCIYEEPHRVSEIKKQIHQVSKDIAIWMFENNSEEASIPQKKFEKICYDIMQKYKNKRKDACEDFLIGNYFKLVKHCEGVETEEVYFVHRSLYEYFVVETIYSSIEKQVKVSRESLASDLGRFLKGNKLSKEMLYYLNLKIRKSKINNEFNMLNGAFRLMLLNGMIYYTNKYYRKEYYKNAIQCEINVFINMLKILHFWRNSFIKFDNSIRSYLFYDLDSDLDLSNSDLRKVNLKGIDLSNSNLKGVDLSGIDLNGENLSGMKLNNSNLEKAKLNMTKLNYASLIGSYLVDANLNGAELSGADLRLSKMNNASLKCINLICADLRGATLKNAYLVKARLSGAKLSGADLMKADLRFADLGGAELDGADLREANLEYANLQYTYLVGAYLQNVCLEGACLKRAILSEEQIIYLQKKINLKESMVYKSGEIREYSSYDYNE